MSDGETIKNNVNDYFGKTVAVEATFIRTRNRGVKRWVRFDIKPRLGKLIGVRYLHDGNVRYYDDHTEWDPIGESIPCLLVVFSPRENAVRVPVDAVKFAVPQ